MVVTGVDDVVVGDEVVSVKGIRNPAHCPFSTLQPREP